MTDAARFRVAVVGCGGMGRTWVRLACEHPWIEPVALVDVRREAAEAMAQRFDLPSALVHDSLGEALERARPDVVFDVTVPAAHAEVTIAALEAGCHVLGEKPMAETIEQARRMVKAARRADRVYAVAQTRRPNPHAYRLIELLRRGAIGPVEEVHADFFLGPHFGGFRDQMDDVLLLDMAIHTFDQARQITAANPVAVYCHAFNPPRSWYRGNASAEAIFEMRNADGREIVFTYRGSWCAEGLNTDWNAAWRVIGEQGSATWDGAENVRAQAVKPDGEQRFMRDLVDLPIPDVSLEHTGHAGIIHDFIDSLRHGRPPMCPCDDNIRSLAMVHAAVDSARKRQRVEVAW